MRTLAEACLPCKCNDTQLTSLLYPKFTCYYLRRERKALSSDQSTGHSTVPSHLPCLLYSAAHRHIIFHTPKEFHGPAAGSHNSVCIGPLSLINWANQDCRLRDDSGENGLHTLIHDGHDKHLTWDMEPSLKFSALGVIPCYLTLE